MVKSEALSELVRKDLKFVWHPAAQMKDYESYPPVAVVRGEGSYLITEDGKRILDIVSSWWCNLLGHCNQEISDALAKQAKTLEHVIFADLTHPLVVRLAEELSKIVPSGLCRFNFADNGSSAVEMALKMAFQYQAQSGHPERIRFACLSGGYHGETIGALSVGSLDLYSKLYKPMMMDNIHISAPDCFRCHCGCKRNQCDCACLGDAKKVFETYGKELCAVIVEPLLQGAAGMRIYPEAYLVGLRSLCDQYGVLLIADEIATGFGRTGEMFACNKAKISPDLMCLSKALTGGYMPMSVVCTTDEIYQAFYADYGQHRAFVHSHTYAGNPLACSCALKVIEILKRDHILEHAAKKAKRLTKMFSSLENEVDEIGEVRHIGLIHAVELVADRQSKKAFDPSLRIGFHIYRKALNAGLLLRNIGDVLYFNPPLNVADEDLEKAVLIMKTCIKSELALYKKQGQDK